MSEETKEGSSDPADVESAGFESNNNSRDESQAIMEADSPDEIDKDLLERIEEERQERLDPDNRPENVEVDNTQRTFIAEEARFEDSDLSADDGIGQKEPDPETQAGSSDDKAAAAADEDDEREQAQQEADSDASTGPQPTDQPTDGDDRPDAGTQAPGRHKA